MSSTRSWSPSSGTEPRFSYISSRSGFDFEWNQPGQPSVPMGVVSPGASNDSFSPVDLRAGASLPRPAAVPVSNSTSTTTNSKLIKYVYAPPPPIEQSPSPSLPPIPRPKRPLPQANTNKKAVPPLFAPKSAGSSSPRWTSAPVPKKVVPAVVVSGREKRKEVGEDEEDEDEEMVPFVLETSKTSQYLLPFSTVVIECVRED